VLFFVDMLLEQITHGECRAIGQRRLMTSP
jgi:hypothetical protein